MELVRSPHHRPLRSVGPLLVRGSVAALLASCVAGVGLHGQATWSLAERPALTIGAPDGRDGHALFDIRGAVVADAGVVVVADGGSSEVRVFDQNGLLLQSIGGPGDGPREFRDVSWIDTCGSEGVLVYDTRRNRLTRWTVDGELLDGFPIDGPVRDLPPYEVKCGPSGRFVVLGWPDVSVRRERGPYRAMVPLGLADARGKLIRSLGTVPGTERMRTTNNDRPHPFGRTTTVDLFDGEVYVATADSFSIQVLAPDGSRRHFGLNQPVTRLSKREQESWVDAYLERAPADQRPSLKRAILETGWVPSSPPALATFIVDATGRTWVRPYEVGPLNPDGLVEWTVFDRRGEAVATASIPRGLRPTDIGQAHILGVRRDALGMETVELWELYR